MQIGANDGQTNDPIYRYVIDRKWSGLLVEPIPSMFERLSHTYRGIPNVRLENCAVASADGMATLYRVLPDESLPPYTQELASFDKKVILKQKRVVRHIDRFIVPIEVPARTVGSLLEEHSIRHLNLLVVDTEGFDDEVLRMVFETELRPDLIQFEWVHLRPAAKAASARRLVEQGYRYLTIRRDALAVRPASIEAG
jgi:FkbM family methyltransferase